MITLGAITAGVATLLVAGPVKAVAGDDRVDAEAVPGAALHA